MMYLHYYLCPENIWHQAYILHFFDFYNLKIKLCLTYKSVNNIFCVYVKFLEIKMIFFCLKMFFIDFIT